jgi:hypothetical protein
VGLDKVTSLKIMPAAGITVGAIIPSADGTTLTAEITADSVASRAVRTITLFTASGPVTAPVISTNLFYVGARPTIVSVSPIMQTVGNSFTLTINGTNLDAATVVRFETPDGTTVINPPVINAAGTQATVSVIIDGMATGGQRVVVISGPYGSSDTTPGANNILTISRPVVQALPTIQMAGKAEATPRTATLSDWPGNTGLLALTNQVMPGVIAWRLTLIHAQSALDIENSREDKTDDTLPPNRIDDRSPLLMAAMTTRGYRGPPFQHGIWG